MTPLGDDVLVRRAARRMARQIAVLVAVAMLALIGVVTALVVTQQQHETDSSLRATASTADDVRDPPAGMWLVLVTQQGTESSPGFPGALTGALAAARRSTASRRSALVTLHGEGVPAYRLLTVHEATRTVQVVADLGPQQRARDQLLRTMELGALASLVVAATVGVVLGRRAVRPLAQALGLQRAFVADASHELRTPLTLLSTRAQLLRSELADGGADAQAVADAQGVVSDVLRIGEVVEDLLIAADPRSELEHVPVDVADVAAQVVASAAAEADAARVELVLSAPTPAQVVGAPAALRRAVLSLVDNAIDHTPEGGEVRVEVRRRRGEVVVRVSDSGPGVAPEHQDHLLTRFHSGGHRSGRAHYGLGLALTHDVANRHGGHLRYVPSASGAVFELVLPVGRALRRAGAPRKP